MTNQPRPPRRDLGGKLPAGLTPINPATSEPIIRWKTDPGEKLDPARFETVDSWDEPVGTLQQILDSIRLPEAAAQYDQDPKPTPEQDKENPMSTEHVVSFDAISSEHFVGTCGGCDWKFESNKLAELNRRGLAHERRWATGKDQPEDQPAQQRSEPTEKDQPEDQPAQQRSEPNDYTMVELVEQLPAGQDPEDQQMVKINRALINGTPVRIAEDGIFIDYGKDAEPGPPGNVVRVHLELLVDEFRIRRVRADYGQQDLTITEGGGLHFEINRGEIDPETQNRFDRLRKERNQQGDKYKDC